MEWIALFGGGLGLLVNIPLILGILQGKVKQNFATYLLWGILDLIAFFTIMLQGGNFWLPLGYAIGAITVGILLFLKGQKSWTLLESFIVSLVIMCLLVWWAMGDRAGNIISVIALMFASIPQIIGTFKDPKTTPTFVYAMFTLAGFLSFLGGSSWTIEDKLFPVTAFFVSGLIAILSIRRVSVKIVN